MSRDTWRPKILVAALVGATLGALGLTVASPRAGTTSTPRQLLVSSKAFGRLTAGVAYGAQTFPISVRLTPPDGTWVGAQSRLTAFGKPAFGWVVLAHPGPKPQGLIGIETAYGSTPSVAHILERLHTAGSGATYGPMTRVTIAGYRGWRIDGDVYSRFGHVFVPFTPRTNGASPPDNIRLERGERFRLMVLDVRGKRLVLFVVSAGLPPAQFPAFLDSARPLLASLRFPA